MKNIFLLGVLLLTQNLSFAENNKISSQCESYSKSKYLVKGDWKSSEGGDRLWNFKKLTQKFNSSDAARCDKEAFKQALEDSNEYWEGIKEKYGCPDSGPLIQCESVNTNLAYLNQCRATYSDHLSDVHEDVLTCDQSPAGHGEARKLIKHHAEILPHLLDTLPKLPHDPCSVVPWKYRKKPNVMEKGSATDAIGACLVGQLQGIFNNVKDLFTGLWDLLKLGATLAEKFGSKMIDFLKAIHYSTMPLFIAETMSEGSTFLKDLAKGLMGIPQMIQTMAKNEVKEWQCMNQTGQANYACKAMAYVGTDVVITVLTGGALKASMLTKAIKPVSTLMRIEKTAMKGAELAKLTKAAEAAKAGGAAAKTSTKVSRLKTVLKGKVPSEEFGKLDISRLSKEQATQVLEKFLGEKATKKTWHKATERLHPDKVEGAISAAERNIVEKEFQLFQELVEKAKFK